MVQHRLSGRQFAGIGSLKALNVLEAYGNGLCCLTESKLTRLGSLRELWLLVCRNSIICLKDSLPVLGVFLVLCKLIMKSISSLQWNFDPNSGNAVMVDHPPKVGHGEASSKLDEDFIKSEGFQPEKVDNDHMVFLLKSGTEKHGRKDYQGALADFDSVCKIDSQCAHALKYSGDIKRILSQPEGALKDLNLAYDIESNDLFTLTTRGAVLKDLFRFEDALKDLDRANELDDNNYYVKTQRGVVKRSLRDMEGALADLSHEANAESPHQAFILTQLGVVMREMRRFGESLEYLNRACELKPNDVFIYKQRGVVRRELQDLEGALDDLNIAYGIAPHDAFTLRRRGITRRELLDYTGSLQDLNMANTLQPFNSFSLVERGVTKKVLGDFQGALEDLCMANHIEPGQAFTLKHRGSVYRELGSLVDALQDLSYANSLEGNDFFTLLELGMTKSLSHDYEGALVHYNNVLEMAPIDPWILHQRGSLRRMLGDNEGALEDLTNLEELQPRLFSIAIAGIQERCFTKYAMNDVAGAFQDASMVRSLWGEYGQSLIMGEKLKYATVRSKDSLKQSSSSSQRELDSFGYVLYIDHEKLVILKNLGRGSYGCVQRCKLEGISEEVAVKYVASNIQDAFEKEVKMLARIQHPRIVRLIGCSYDKKEKLGLLVMEMMECNLRSLIESSSNSPPFDLPTAVNLMIQIAEGLEYLHEQGVLHRDLKSTNILVNPNHSHKDGTKRYVVKIADFGMAKLQTQNNMPYFMTLNAGTTFWRAPEVFNTRAYQRYSYPADVWSYGMTCFEILTGEVPFEDYPCAQIHSKITEGLRPELPASCPGVLKLLLKKCWAFAPSERPSFLEIRRFLKLYYGTCTSRDICDFRAGDAIRPCEITNTCNSG